MAHRIEVELTSQTGDSTWTWRAAGAKQPRGTVDAALVPEGSGVGSVLRAEVETTLDGTTVTALLPHPRPRPTATAGRSSASRSSARPNVAPTSTWCYAGKGKRRRDERPEGPREGGRRPADRRPRTEGGGRGPRTGRPDRRPR